MTSGPGQLVVAGPCETKTSLESIELAVVIPTYNEKENIAPLLAVLEKALAGVQ